MLWSVRTLWNIKLPYHSQSWVFNILCFKQIVQKYLASVILNFLFFFFLTCHFKLYLYTLLKGKNCKDEVTGPVEINVLLWAKWNNFTFLYLFITLISCKKWTELIQFTVWLDMLAVWPLAWYPASRGLHYFHRTKEGKKACVEAGSVILCRRQSGRPMETPLAELFDQERLDDGQSGAWV